MAWETEELLVAEPTEWHVPHHDTVLRGWNYHQMAGLSPRVAGLSFDVRDISHRVLDMSLCYYAPGIHDTREMSPRATDPVVGVQTASMGWHALRVVFFARTVNEVAACELQQIKHGGTCDIAAVLTSGDSLVSISGRGVWGGHRNPHSQASQDWGVEDEFAILLPANEASLAALCLPVPEDDLDVYDEAKDRIGELRKTAN